MIRRVGVVAVVVAAVLPVTAGCKKKEMMDASRSNAPAPITEPVPSPVPGPVGAPMERSVVDAEVRRHWKAVEVTVREKNQGGDGKAVQIPLDGEAKVPGTPLSIKVLAFVPDFAMGAESITTKSMKDANPAVKIQIFDGGKEIFKGWAFRDFPDMHSFEDPRYTIQMTRAIATGT